MTNEEYDEMEKIREVLGGDGVALHEHIKKRFSKLTNFIVFTSIALGFVVFGLSDDSLLKPYQPLIVLVLLGVQIGVGGEIARKSLNKIAKHMIAFEGKQSDA